MLLCQLGVVGSYVHKKVVGFSKMDERMAPLLQVKPQRHHLPSNISQHRMLC